MGNPTCTHQLAKSLCGKPLEVHLGEVKGKLLEDSEQIRHIRENEGGPSIRHVTLSFLESVRAVQAPATHAYVYAEMMLSCENICCQQQHLQPMYDNIALATADLEHGLVC